MITGLVRWSLLIFLSLVSLHASSASTTVAVASNFSQTVKVLVAGFEAQTDNIVRVVSGSSGKLYAQISHGAPFDFFLSADQARPKALITSGEVVAGSQFTYAVGALALLSVGGNQTVAPDEVLRSGGFDRLALANPRLAPYGVAAVEVLENLGLVDKTRNKWVQGENISQAYQFVATGNADLGFVALSQLKGDKSRPAGSFWIVPDNLYSPIRQDAVLLKRGRNNAVARAFLKYLRSDKARHIIKSAGYNVIGGHQK